MPAYHSALNGAVSPEVCGLAMLPLKGRVRGPAKTIDSAGTTSTDNSEADIVDEALTLFRANVLFRMFEVQGPADRVLVYLTLVIHQCLKKLERVPLKSDATRILAPLISGAHIMPGEPGWPLGTLIPAAKTTQDAETLRAYLKQLRETLLPRLLDRVYDADGNLNKFWIAFSKRKFLNKEFPS